MAVVEIKDLLKSPELWSEFPYFTEQQLKMQK